MKRMTSNEYNPCFNCNFYSSCSHIRENFPVCPERARYDRLAAIEDILGDEYDLDELREMVQAKREGRCVVLPCQPGDRIWIDGRKAIIEEFFGYKTERYFHAQFYDNMQYIDVPFEEIEKTVFLTRADAEAALRREQDEQTKP